MKKKAALCLSAFVFFCSVGFSWAQSESDPYSKIGPLLRKQMEEWRKIPTAPFSTNGIPQEEEEEVSEITKVIVVIDRPHLEELPKDLIDELRTRVESLGGYIGDHAFNNVQVWLPIEKIEELASWSEIKAIRLPIKPQMNRIISEGVNVVLGVKTWHNNDYKGRGVKVGVIDFGFQGYSSLLGTELPATVTTRIFGSFSEFISDPHGTACAEIIHDMAPEASLFLVNLTDMDVGFMNAVMWLMTQRVDIISSSIGLNSLIFCKYVYELLHGSSTNLNYVLDQIQYFVDLKEQLDYILNDVVKCGFIWTQAAGNDGQKQWTGAFSDPDGDNLLNFTSLDNFNEIDVSGAYFGQPVHVLLMWGFDNDFNSYDDYDLFILDDYGLIASSEIDQSTLPITLEACKFYPIPGVKYWAVIERYWAAPQEITLLLGAHKFPKFKYPIPRGTIELTPPAQNPKVITVGAVPYDDHRLIEPFSSQGPSGDGTIKPDLVAPDWVSTYSYGLDGFPGTSAAAPHVAGICALIKQRYPNWSPAQVKTYLESNAIDLGSRGKDNVFGSGLVRLPEISSPPSSKVNINGRVTYGGNPVCAMTLANGQYMFTPASTGDFSLNVPLDSKGQITLYVFCSGLAPFKRVIYPQEGQGMRIALEKATPGQGMDVNCLFTPTSPTRVRLSGAVYYKGNPVCAMVLANGQYMFTCSGDGSFSLDVPLDSKGGITLFAFCSGLPQYRYDYMSTN